MKKIGTRCNLIPVLSKADTLTESELQLNKKLIRDDLDRETIDVFNFGIESQGKYGDIVGDDNEDEDKDEDEDDESIESEELEIQLELKRLQNMIPFSIMCSSQSNIDEEGNTFHFREFPWGTVNVENTKNNEFNVLKSILLSTHIQELKDSTDQKIYESYRTEKLQQ